MLMLLRLNARFMVATGALLGALAIAAASAAPAHAAWNCSASAIRGQVLTAPGIEPVTANKGATACADASAGLGDQLGALPLPLSVNLLSAKTAISGTGTGQSISATGGLGQLAVKSLPDLPIPLDQVPIPGSYADVAPVFNNPIFDTLGVVIDIRPIVQQIIDQRKLPNTDILSISALTARVTGNCQDGRAALSGSHTVTGVKVLGQDVKLDETLSKVVNLINSQSIDPSTLTSVIPKPAALAAVTDPLFQQALQPALDALPNIEIPATAATVRLTAGEQVRDGATLTQRALRAQVTIAGQSLADLVVGEATGTGDNAVCAQQSVQDLALQCTKRRLVLIDVFQRGRKVVLYGAADKKYIGRRVSVVFPHTGRTVARPKVAKDGTFRATAALPAQRIRRTNLSRYQARIDKEKSLNLKLWRRMVVTKLQGSSGKVRIVGRVILPLGKPVQPIKVKQRVSCKRSKVVKVFKPHRNGRFDVTLPAPTKQAAATYRMESKVRFRVGLDRLFPTFTLPRYVRVD
jgi:hypothetical protein